MLKLSTKKRDRYKEKRCDSVSLPFSNQIASCLFPSEAEKKRTDRPLLLVQLREVLLKTTVEKRTSGYAKRENEEEEREKVDFTVTHRYERKVEKKS